MKYKVFINNRNLVTWTRNLAWQCSQLDDVDEVVIIDNASSYPPLLAWYKACPYRVVRMANIGPRALWSTTEDLTKHYVLTDSDMDLHTAPHDLLNQLRYVLDRYPEIIKAGPSVEIDDVPDAYPFKQQVLQTEERMWQPFPHDQRYYGGGNSNCEIDTHFAMYRPNQGWGGYKPCLKTKRPYTVRHLSWYVTEPWSDEWQYYIDHLEIKNALYWSTLEWERAKQRGLLTNPA